LGLEQHKSVAIVGFNSPEWVIADLAAVFAGSIAAGIYATNSPEMCRFMANHCKANIIVVEDDKQLDKIMKIKDELTGIPLFFQSFFKKPRKKAFILSKLSIRLTCNS
jgi:long-chain-fatty-acid--CoA ligase ACSBG